MDFDARLPMRVWFLPMVWVRSVFGVLYFLSAAAALALEVAWMRSLASDLGSTVEATACALAAFMGGLGAGAWAAGAVGDRFGKPLRVFGVAQAASALAAFLPSGARLASSPLTFISGLALIALASFPLGWSFPLASRAREMDGTGRGGRLGVLYALDTAGAVVGCLMAGVVLVPQFGLFLTLLGTAAVKLLVAVSVFLLPGGATGRSVDVFATKESKGLGGVLWLVAIMGFSLLGAEALWNRLLAFVLYRGSTTYAFVAMLCSVLGSASLGAWVAGRRTRTPPAAADLAYRWAIPGGASLLFSLALLLLVGPVPSTGPVGAVDLLVTLAATGPASFFSGAIFSSACQAAACQGAARWAGRVLSVNTLAAVFGALAVPLVLVPLAGLGASLALLGVLPILWGVWGAWKGKRSKPWVALLALLSAALLPLAGPRWSRHLGPVLFYHEGPDVSVAVVADPEGTRRLYVDGIAVAGTDLAMSTDQKSLAHLPLLLHPKPQSVLTVGFGSGGTSHSLLLHPDVQVDCVEISEEVVRAAPYLYRSSLELLQGQDPRYRLHLMDARTFLAQTRRTWDVIVNDCTDLAYRSDASLYTLEVFGMIRAHLKPGGIAAAWIPLRGEPPYRALKSVVRTFGAVFDFISLWVLDDHPVHFGILVGANRPAAVNLSRIRWAMGILGIARDLEGIGLGDPYRLATSQHLGDGELREFAEGVAPHTDDRPVVEFWAPLESGDDASAYRLLQAAGSTSPPLVLSVLEGEHELLASRALVRPWLLAGHRAFLEGDEQQARMLYVRALRLSPRDPSPRELLGIQEEKVYRLAQRVTARPHDKRAMLELGAVRLIEGEDREALSLLDTVQQLDPQNKKALLGMGMARLALGDCRAARRLFQELLSGDLPRALEDRALAGWLVSGFPGFFCRCLWSLTLAGL